MRLVPFEGFDKCYGDVKLTVPRTVADSYIDLLSPKDATDSSESCAVRKALMLPSAISARLRLNAALVELESSGGYDVTQ